MQQTSRALSPSSWAMALARKMRPLIYRFANFLGAPSVLTAGHYCYGPRISTSIVTCGTNPIADYENLPKCIMVWGNNVVIPTPIATKESRSPLPWTRAPS